MIFVLRGPMRRLVGFKRELRVDGPTVQDGLSALCLQYPDLQSVLFNASGELRGVHRVALNSTLLSRGEMNSAVADDDVVDVVTAVAGG